MYPDAREMLVCLKKLGVTTGSLVRDRSRSNSWTSNADKRHLLSKGILEQFIELYEQRYGVHQNGVDQNGADQDRVNQADTIADRSAPESSVSRGELFVECRAADCGEFRGESLEGEKLKVGREESISPTKPDTSRPLRKPSIR